MLSNTQIFFLALLRQGIGFSSNVRFESINWPQIKFLADHQCLSAVILDGVERLPESLRPSQDFLLQWIGEALKLERISELQQKTAERMSMLFHQHDIRTYVLKGHVVAECYPIKAHRSSVDLDCFLMPENNDFDAWSLGNDLIKSKGYVVSFDYYKNSTFYLPNLVVENHQYFTPFRGNKRLAEFERLIHSLMRKQKTDERFDDVWLYRPPVIVTALFLIEHSYSHFLHEGLTWRHVLDWMLFYNRFKNELDWAFFHEQIDKYGLRQFYDSFFKIGCFLLYEETGFNKQSELMLNDIWRELDLHETRKGIKGKILLAGNTWRARWKYRYFSEISMLHALLIQVTGVLFKKKPQLT